MKHEWIVDDPEKYLRRVANFLKIPMRSSGDLAAKPVKIGSRAFFKKILEIQPTEIHLNGDKIEISFSKTVQNGEFSSELGPGIAIIWKTDAGAK